MKLTWLGHSAFHVEMAGTQILLDPFFTGNGKFPAGYEDRLEKVDLICLTHGHSDHVGDAARLAAKYDSVVAAQPEICQHIGKSGHKKFQPMNIGGTVQVGEIAVSMVQAFHSSTITEDGTVINMGDPAGIVLRAGRDSLYHAGDTGLFSDMALIQRLFAPRVGLIPIGDRFTMGPEAAAIACNEFLDLETVIPIHWGTFGLLTGTPEAFAPLVKRGKVVVPEPGAVLEL